MQRVILDTNVFIGSAYNAGSSSRTVVDACREGRLTLLVSEAIRKEYLRMLPRAVRGTERLAEVMDLIETATVVETGLTPRVVGEDPDDDKFFWAAWAAESATIVSNDRHLLEIDGAEGVRVVRPGEMAHLLKQSGQCKNTTRNQPASG